MDVMAAIGPLVGGITGMMQASYQAKVADMNAEVAAENAKRALERGGIEAEDNDMQTRALLGEQEVAQAASGVSLSGKSQILTRKSARILGRRDALNILQDASTESYNYKVQEANFKAEKSAAKLSGFASLVGGVAGAISSMPSSMVGGSTSTASSYKYVPKPLAKPTLVSKYIAPQVNPLLRNRLSFGH